MRLLRAEQSDLPEFWQEIWRHVPGNKETRVEGMQVNTRQGTHLEQALEAVRQFDSTGWEGIKIFGRSTTHALIRSIAQLFSDFPEHGGIVDVEKLRKRLPPQMQKTKFISKCMDVLRAEGYVDAEWHMRRPLPSETESTAMICRLEREGEEICGTDASVGFAKRNNEHLSDVLQGRMNPLTLLFPEEPEAVGAQRFYAGGNTKDQIQILIPTARKLR